MRSLASLSKPLVRHLGASLVPALAALALLACQGPTVVGNQEPAQAGPPVAMAPAPRTAQPVITQQTIAPLPGTSAARPPAQAAAPVEPGTPEGEQVKVALLLPLSGASAALGQALLNAAQLALFEVAEGNLGVLVRDTAGTPEGAAGAAQAVLSEGARLILGPLFATEVSAVAPIARQAGVNVVALSTDERVAGQGVFLMGFLARTQVTRVVSFAHSQGLNRFAALLPESSYGQTIEQLLRGAVGAAGAALDEIESYDPAAGGAAPAIRSLARYEGRHAALLAQRKELEGKTDEASRLALQRLDAEDALGGVGFDGLMLPEGGEPLLALAPLVPYYDIDPAKVRLLGTGLWDDPRLGKEPALLGGWYAAPDPKARAEFETRYAQLYGKVPPPRIATLGYDAMALAAVLARTKGAAGFGVAELTSPNGFSGLDGIFRFRADGLIERGLAVLEVQRDAPKIVSPAPASFAGE